MNPVTAETCWWQHLNKIHRKHGSVFCRLFRYYEKWEKCSSESNSEAETLLFAFSLYNEVIEKLILTGCNICIYRYIVTGTCVTFDIQKYPN